VASTLCANAFNCCCRASEASARCEASIFGITCCPDSRSLPEYRCGKVVEISALIIR
jgi:hypothetical protein